MSEPIPIPVDGVLDLHPIRPQDVKEVVNAYLEACIEKQIFEVRIIHGKGIGQIRNSVHAVLAKHPKVQRFALASEAFGGNGATFVWIRNP